MGTVRIDAATDPRLDDYRGLTDQVARRRYEGDELFVAEGYVAIDRLIESGHAIRSALLTPARVDRFATQIGELDRRGVAVYVAERELIADVVGFDLHRGVLAVADRRPLPSLDAIATSSRRIAVLEGLNDPENVGVIARAARALFVDALVLDPRCTDPYTRRTVRVSMGEVLHLPVARATAWPAGLDVLHAAGFETWALTPDGDADDIWSLDTPTRLALVLGAEGPGLDGTTIARAHRRVRIPIDPRVDSLNVGHAAAIAFALTTPSRLRRDSVDPPQ